MVELYDYQRKAVNKLSSGNILLGDVGSGKSFTSLFYYKERLGYKKLYIITTAAKRNKNEWQKDCEELGLSCVVDSWNNIEKYSNVTNAFFIFDEQRVVGYGKWSKTFIKIAQKNMWILCSATPGDNYIDYLPVFVANGFYKNKTEFTRNHVEYDPYAPFPRIRYYKRTEILERYIKQISVKMEDMRVTKLNETIITTDYDKELYSYVVKERFNPYTDKPIENASEYCSVLRRIVNGSDRRRENAKEQILLNNKLIIFYNFTYELEILREICEEIGRPYSEYNGKRHQDIPDTDEWVYLVQYLAGAEGWNCILTDTIMFYSLNYSHRIIHQAKGRINRVNTPFKELYYIFLKSKSKIDDDILKCIRQKKTFNEKRWYEKGVQISKGTYQ